MSYNCNVQQLLRRLKKGEQRTETSIYFLAKNRLPLTATFDRLVQLQITNGDELLQQHVKGGPQNAQYTSKFSAVMLLEAINSWLDRKLIES